MKAVGTFLFDLSLNGWTSHEVSLLYLTSRILANNVSRRFWSYFVAWKPHDEVSSRKIRIKMASQAVKEQTQGLSRLSDFIKKIEGRKNICL
jgi:hypothetical protein